jgi:multidrug efflux pump
MTITLAAVYAPIGFLGGLTGALFREFAFTLAGSVIISGVIALTLSPMMCSVLLKGGHQNQGRFAKLVDRVFTRLTDWYGRKLDRSLDYRPITGLFAVAILFLVGFMYVNTNKELAPEEDQGILFSVTKAPQYANIDYSISTARNSTRFLRVSPKPICASSSTASMDRPTALRA